MKIFRHGVLKNRGGSPPIVELGLNVLLPIPDNPDVDTETKLYYEVHSKRGHIKLTDDKIDVREALDKKLMVVEVQEIAFYLSDAVVRTLVFRQIKTI